MSIHCWYAAFDLATCNFTILPEAERRSKSSTCLRSHMRICDRNTHSKNPHSCETWSAYRMVRHWEQSTSERCTDRKVDCWTVTWRFELIWTCSYYLYLHRSVFVQAELNTHVAQHNQHKERNTALPRLGSCTAYTIRLPTRMTNHYTRLFYLVLFPSFLTLSYATLSKLSKVCWEQRLKGDWPQNRCKTGNSRHTRMGPIGSCYPCSSNSIGTTQHTPTPRTANFGRVGMNHATMRHCLSHKS